MLLEVHNNNAVCFKDTFYSYEQLLKDVAGFSKYYENIKGEKIAIFSSNSYRWIAAFYSAWNEEAIALPIDYMATKEEVAYILSDSRPKVLFTSKENYELTIAAVELSEASPKVLTLEDLDLSSDEVASIPIPEDINQTSLIIYTSGTTGGPKGVMLSYKNILVNIKSVTEDIAIYKFGCKSLALLPYHHIFPLMGAMIAPLKVGGGVIIPNSIAGEDIMKAMQTHKIDVLIGVPRFFALLHKGIMAKINKSAVARFIFAVASRVNRVGFSKFVFKKVQAGLGGNLQHCPCGGAAIDRALAKDLITLGFPILAGYGMSETAPMISFTHPGKYKIGTAGFILPEADVKIVDGEICVKGDIVMNGYLNKPEETEAVFNNGYLCTGDLGHIDEEGYLCITGRKKEIIVLPNGKNVNPEEIEFKLIRSETAIQEVAVFFDNKVMHAIIRPDFKVTSEKNILNINEYFMNEVVADYNSEVASYKKILKVTIVTTDLPRTRIGKLKRFELLNFVESKDKKKKEVEEPTFEEYKIIKDFLSTTTSVDIFPDDNIEVDLALDSLDKVNLLSFIEKTFGIKIEEDILINNLVVEDLSKYIRDNKEKIEIAEMNFSELISDSKNIEISSGSMVHTFLMGLVRGVTKLFFRVKVSGQDTLPEVPCIIAPNHQSYLDAAFLVSKMPRRVLDKTFFGAKVKHIDRFGIRSVVAKSQTIGIDLNKDLDQSITKMAAVLKSGHNLVIFPEGTRSRDGKMGDFKKLYAILSKELNVPVVPVGISGAYDILSRENYIPKLFARVNITFIRPIFPKNKDVEQIIKQTRDEIALEI